MEGESVKFSFFSGNREVLTSIQTGSLEGWNSESGFKKEMPMNYGRLALAFLGATIAYFACGFILLAALPGMKGEFMKYPDVYRSHVSMMKVMPYIMAGILVSIAVVAVLYAKIHPAGGDIVSGVSLGALMGIFSVCVYAIHNYALLNIGPRLALYEGVTYFIQWVVVGAAIGLIYKPS